MNLWEKLRDRVCEYQSNISTRGVVPVTGSDAYHYATMSYAALQAILSRLSLRASDVFIDIGCGKGRVVCCAARFNIHEVIGIEANQSLYEIARANAASIHSRRCPITIINAQAQDVDYHKGTIFYLFNPFGASTLSQVLTKIQSSLNTNLRPLTIVYANPVHESVLAESGWLQSYDRWERSKNRHAVSFWKSQAGR